MIVVATDDFRLYHAVVQELRDRGVVFTTVEPDESLPEGATVVITASNDCPEAGDEPPSDVEFVTADPDRPRVAVDQALAVLRGGGGRTIVGVAISGGKLVATIVGAVALLPLTVVRLGVPNSFAVPVGAFAGGIATIGLFQFVTGRELI